MYYQINEGKFKLPESWQDQSVNAFTLPNSQVNFVINRMPLVEGVNHEDFYHQIMHQFESLTNYHLIEHRQFELQNQPVHLLEYDWKSPESHIYQLAVLWIVGKQLLTFTFTSTIPLTESQKDYLLNIVYSFEPTTE
ncbi:hypothetical protein RO21_11760 [[Actinobacillus] muris]|uniref:DUF1795 domain-containing protein n=1 Tax=Muribacter muris TaxID=67855 RepID=A0A0J5P2F0_9PAST|nr:DcrB-related protein [Muribacter muris]KMK50441.1 hypothetical protein RO21_11760 [[Actinobacillus] muris] [Muribacter muris]MBF0786251.1 DcrB-related protein [Muribacter muris]MBF0828057.1 DcrB-related protein [Muribacter muris]TFV07388.1 DUF1795 domain-containing protein [Muribacter muris]